MSFCELCGKPAAERKMVVVDSTVFTVCLSCSKRGKPYIPAQPTAKRKPRVQQPAKRDRISMSDATILVPDFARIVREARMDKGLTHEQLGLSMNEKATILRKIETGGLKPDIAFANKLERFLDIKLYVSAADEDS